MIDLIKELSQLLADALKARKDFRRKRKSNSREEADRWK